ncbi:heat shock protein Hsp20 [Planoprotostelium fungivorum]|uniref:Heat shock protein Hsp20 n=1 Tax=Planoprotostelium fungivorum TaxID=1890364 RepID=A0A2P6NMY9_9EUKA|nr:heat shock protein Hsp20 [Planoprotostelium fungivorum]
MPKEDSTKTLSVYHPDSLFDFRDIYSPFLDLQTLKPLFDEKHRRASHGLQKTTDGYVVEAELAGIPKENVSVEVKDGVLHISGKQKVEEEKEGRKMYSRSDFYQSIRLPKDVDQESVKASYVDGLLKVQMKGRELKDNTKRIAID